MTDVEEVASNFQPTLVKHTDMSDPGNQQGEPPEDDMSGAPSPVSPVKPKSKTYEGGCHCGKVKYEIPNDHEALVILTASQGSA